MQSCRELKQTRKTQLFLAALLPQMSGAMQDHGKYNSIYMERCMPQQAGWRHPSILDAFSPDCFGSCSENPDAHSTTATGKHKMDWSNHSWVLWKKTSKLHRSKQPQQFLRLNSTCSQIGTSCSSAVSGNSHCCHSAAVAALPFLLLLATNFVLFCLFFLPSFPFIVKETSGSFLENLRHLDEKLIFSDAVFLLLQLLLLRSIRPEVPLFLEKVLCHCTAAFDRFAERRISQKFGFS